MTISADLPPIPRWTHSLCATAALLSIALLAGCQTTAPVKPVAPPVAAEPPAPHQLTADQPDFLKLPNMAADKTPIRVGIILPFTNPSAGTRGLANAMLKSAELALYDSGNHDIVLMTADDTGTPADVAAAGQKLLAEGAEIIIGPLFSQSVAAVAPLARDKGVPVLAFSTDRSVAGNGVYLLSFQPQSEVKRVISYAISQGHKDFTALIPQTAYGDVVEQTFRASVTASGGTVSDVERFVPNATAAMAPATTAAKTKSDAIFIAQGGTTLRTIVSMLAYNGVDHDKVKLLGTGLWDDTSITKEAMLTSGWFAAPPPDAATAFETKYRDVYGSTPPQLATLAYDAVSLVALLAPGQPYHRFTLAALTDPNGFAGIDGIFRFRPDGSLERGLAVLEVTPGGFTVVSPAPTTFQGQGS
jgi:ABC-type branched-subunit amino acid transport system substrate-binding protein